MISTACLDDLLARGREAVGPTTAHPFVALDLTQTPAGLGAPLTALPCPVIGIGEGPVQTACDVVLPDTRHLSALQQRIEAAPIAAMVLVQLLRAAAVLPPSAALLTESLAYATLQNGPEFRAWRQSHPATPPGDGGSLDCRRDAGALHLTLNRPARHNVIGITLRDALCEALDLAILDTSITTIHLRGAGKCFSTGGDLAEFGAAPDPATAHWVRSLRLPATRLLPLGPRLTAHLHGATIGAGIEMAACAGTVIATETAWFQLPELTYGLIPGAGGTVSLTRRIGRQRTAFLALSGLRINARTAHAWGLVDHLVPPAPPLRHAL